MIRFPCCFPRLKEGSAITEEEIANLETAVAAEVADAVAFAESGKWEPVEELTRFVYSQRRAA